MRKALLLSLFGSFLFLGTTPLLAQETAAVEKMPRNVLGIAPTGLYNKVRIKYERILGSSISLGVIGTYYHREYPGRQITPFARFYFDAIAPEGVYLQAQVCFFDQKITEDPHQQGVLHFAGTGYGIGLGNQWFFGDKEQFCVDTMLGYKKYEFDEKSTTIVKAEENDWYELLNPGSPFNGSFSIGYVF